MTTETARAGAEPAVEVRTLAKRYGRLVAVDGVDFTVDQGVVSGFVRLFGPVRRQGARSPAGPVAPPPT